MRTMRVVLGWTLCTGLTWAGAAFAGPGSQAPNDKGDAAQLQAALDSRPLFVEIDAAPAGSKLAFWIEVDGRPWLHEVLTLGPTQAARPAYELLAHEPARLEELYRLAARPGADVRWAAALDERILRRGTFAELVAENRALKATRFQPEVAAERVFGSADAARQQQDESGSGAPSRATTDVCRNECYAQFWDCIEACQCGSGICPLSGELPVEGDKDAPARLPGCNYCYTQRDACLATCPPPPCTPTSSTYQTTELVGVTYGGWQCFYSFFGPPSNYGEYYQTVYLQYKVSTYRKTVNCDGTQTIELVSVSYTTTQCNRPIYLGCFSPFSYPWNVCYI